MIIDPTDLSNFDNRPDESLHGLSQRNLIALSTFPFQEASPIRLRDDIQETTLNELPFFCLAETLLHIVARESKIKLTKNGYLPIKIVMELYKKKIITNWMIESDVSNSYREHEVIFIHAARLSCQKAGLIKKRNNQLSLTKKGEKLLFNRIALFPLILYAHSCDFDTASFDNYADGATGQYGGHAIIYLFLKYGQVSRPTTFYASAYLQLFPRLIENFERNIYSTPIEQFQSCFEVRACTRFNDWWGFTITDTKWFGFEMFTIVTELVEEVFEFRRH